MLENVLITNDAIVVGILFFIFILIFKATESKNKFARLCLNICSLFRILRYEDRRNSRTLVEAFRC